jgi:uncharacterized protein with HEPN domain
MSDPRRDIDYLEDVLEAIRRIQLYTKEFGWDDFIEDIRTQDAVVRNLEIIGEATKHVSDEFRTQYPHIPWKDLAGVRDKLINHYFGVNNEIVWQIIENDLPSLFTQIDEILGLER